MEILRFDEEVSIPISEFGSDLKIGPLTGRDSHVRVQVMHIAPGGGIGFHAAAARQLLAVVAGTGWVTGDDRVRRELGPGRAALWERAEGHQTGTDVGLTAICIEGEFEVSATPEAT
jgi:quercetin dioxygenase-like cupin family protein